MIFISHFAYLFCFACLNISYQFPRLLFHYYHGAAGGGGGGGFTTFVQQMSANLDQTVNGPT